MARVQFTVSRNLDIPADRVFAELIDWKAHEDWVPLTKVVIHSGDGGAGTEFTATSGIKPLALPDRMRIDSLDAEAMTVHVTKLGPVLTGTVELSVTSTGAHKCRLDWFEDVRVPVLPQFLATPVGAAARQGFTTSIKKMAKKLAKQ
jgi:carbon monoxide dehydrogenase subunit G